MDFMSSAVFFCEEVEKNLSNFTKLLRIGYSPWRIYGEYFQIQKMLTFCRPMFTSRKYL